MYERTYNKTVLPQGGSPERKPFPWKKMIIIGSCVALITGAIFFIRAPRLQVRTVDVVDTHVADPVEVSQFVLGELSGHYLWILPKSSIVLVAPGTLALRIKEQFPRFRAVSVDRASVHSLTVTVDEYAGTYLWCDDECSFMDEQGIVFADAPIFSGSAYLKIYNGSRQSFPFQGLSQNELAMVSMIRERLTAIGIDPIEFRFENEHKLSVIFVHNTSEARIFFDPTSDIESALQALYTGLRTDPLMRLYHDKAQVLQYLDIRFDSKVVYKFQ